MIIESKIQVGDGGVSGFNEFSLKYDPGTQDEYAEKYGHRVDGQENDVLYHEPDNGSPIPARVTKRNKWLYLETAVLGADDNAVISSVGRLKRLVEQAINQSAETVRVALTPSGTDAQTTYYDILQGYVDDSGAYYQDAETASGSIAPSIVLILECKPYGYGDRFTLRNDLPSSPHMIEDSNDDGLADGLTKIGTPSAYISSGVYLIGGKSQAITTSSASEGFYCLYSVSGTIGDTAVAKGYIRLGNDSPVTCQIRNGSGTTIDSAVMPADAVNTIIGPDGGEWYEFNLSGTATATAGWRLYVYAIDSGAIFFTDGLYLQEDTLAVPSGWCSSSSLKNRYDPASTTAATRQQINYLDVWGIPGDLPAKLITEVDISSSTSTPITICGKSTAGKIDPASSIFTIDGGLFQSVVSEFSTVTDSSRLDGQYLRNTNSGATETTAVTPGVISNAGGFVGWDDIFTKPHRVFVLGRSSLLGNEISFNFTDGDSFGGQFSSENVWELIDCGLFIYPGAIVSGGYAENLNVSCTAASASNIDIDQLIFIPVDDLLVYTDNYISGNTFYMDGDLDLVYQGFINRPYIGSIPSGIPSVLNRMIFSTFSQSNIQDITDTIDVSLTVIQCTSHLLGTS